MAYEHIPDHAEEAIVKLIPPFWGKPRIASLLLSWIDQIQELEDVIRDTISLREIDTADLPRLKILGKIVGQIFPGGSTEAYRKIIRSRIAANNSRGIASDILTVVGLIFGTDTVVSLLDLQRGAIALIVWGESSYTDVQAAEYILPDARPAGVSLDLYTSESPDAPTGPGSDFILGDSGDPLVGDPLWSVSAL